MASDSGHNKHHDTDYDNDATDRAERDYDPLLLIIFAFIITHHQYWFVAD
jgi:hypothetical protein